jgi:hypothetical protein
VPACAWPSQPPAPPRPAPLQVLGFAVRALAFSSRPLESDGTTHHLAVGGAKGELWVRGGDV